MRPIRRERIHLQKVAGRPELRKEVVYVRVAIIGPAQITRTNEKAFAGLGNRLKFLKEAGRGIGCFAAAVRKDAAVILYENRGLLAGQTEDISSADHHGQNRRYDSNEHNRREDGSGDRHVVPSGESRPGQKIRYRNGKQRQ